MRTPACFAAVVLLALGATAAWADGLLFQLPEDGTWARYDLEATMTRGDETRTAEGLIQMASVGRVTEGDQPCRWIEVRFEAKENRGGDGDQKSRVDVLVTKVLIPEKHLAKGEDPLKHAVRAWSKHQDRDQPKELKDPANFERGPLPLVLAAPSKDQKELEAVVVPSKAGDLACKGMEGKVEFHSDRVRTIKGTIETRLHPKAPFGTVSSHWALEMHDDGPSKVRKATLNLKLADFGTGAKSEMPGQK